MKISKVDDQEVLVDVEEIELSHYGLTEYAGTEIKIKDLKNLINLELKNRQNLQFEKNNYIKFIQIEPALKMILECLYNSYKDNENMKVRFD